MTCPSHTTNPLATSKDSSSVAMTPREHPESRTLIVVKMRPRAGPQAPLHTENAVLAVTVTVLVTGGTLSHGLLERGRAKQWMGRTG